MEKFTERSVYSPIKYNKKYYEKQNKKILLFYIIFSVQISGIITYYIYNLCV